MQSTIMSKRLHKLILNSLLFVLIWGQTAGSALAESPLDGSIPSALQVGVARRLLREFNRHCQSLQWQSQFSHPINQYRREGRGGSFRWYFH